MSKLGGLEVTFPKEILLTIKEDKKKFEKKVKKFTAIRLFEQGKVSSGLGAAEINLPTGRFYLRYLQIGSGIIIKPARSL